VLTPTPAMNSTASVYYSLLAKIEPFKKDDICSYRKLEEFTNRISRRMLSNGYKHNRNLEFSG